MSTPLLHEICISWCKLDPFTSQQIRNSCITLFSKAFTPQPLNCLYVLSLFGVLFRGIRPEVALGLSFIV